MTFKTLEEDASRYISLYQLTKHFKPSTMGTIGQFVGNPPGFITTRVSNAIANKVFSILLQNFYPYQALKDKISDCSPGKDKGLVALSKTQLSLGQVESFCAFLSKYDPSRITADSIRMIAKDLKLTLGDAKKVLEAWGSFNEIVKEIEMIAKEELINPLQNSADTKSVQLENEYQESLKVTQDYSSVSQSSWLGLPLTLASNTLTAVQNTGIRARNLTSLASTAVQKGMAQSVPFVAGTALVLVKKTVDSKITDLERNLKGRVVTGAVDLVTKKVIAFTLKTFIEFYVIATLYTFINKASIKEDDNSDFAKVKSYAMVLLPILFTVGYYWNTLRVWRKDRMDSQRMITQVSEQVSEKWNSSMSLKMVGYFSGTIIEKLKSQGLSDGAINKFQDRALKVIESRFTDKSVPALAPGEASTAMELVS